MTYRSTYSYVLILIPFGLGIMASHYCQFTKLNLAINLIAIITLILLLFFNTLYRLLKVYNYKYFIGGLLYIFFFTFGFNHFHRQHPPGISRFFADLPADFLLIKIANEPQVRQTIYRFEASVLQVYLPSRRNEDQSDKMRFRRSPSIGNLLVDMKITDTVTHRPAYGELYIIPASYVETAPPYNPGEFDFKSWLAAKNIFHRAVIFQHAAKLLDINQGNRVINFSLAFRQRQLKVYRKFIRNDEAFALASTLLLGYRADLSPETLSIYSRTGTIHALSVSGMHVGIIYMVIAWALQILNRRKDLKIIKSLMIICFIWSYTLITGCSPSVLRAAVMLSVLVVAKSWNRNTNSYNILAFSAFVLLLYDPLLLWDTGFQLSYLSVFGLIWLQPQIYKLIYIKWKWLDAIWSLSCLSLAAQIATFPLSIYYFHQFPLSFLVGNLFIALPITLLMYLGILLLLLRQQWIASIFEWLMIETTKGLAFLSKLPYAVADGIWINRSELVLLCLFLILLINALGKRSKIQLFAAAVVVLLLEIHLAYDKIILSQQQKIILFSINKNYAVAFITEHTAILISDLKATDQRFKFSIKPALDQLKITQLHCISSNRDTLINNLVITGPQVIFKGFSILLLDKVPPEKKFAQPPLFDAVWIQYNPNKQSDNLLKEIRYKQLWIDSSNKNYAIKRYQEILPDKELILLRNKEARIIDLCNYRYSSVP